MNNLIQSVAYKLDSPFLQQFRINGRLAFESKGLPKTKEEAWKYTPLRDIQAKDYELPISFSEVKTTIPFDCYIINFYNGHIVGNYPDIDGVYLKDISYAEQYIGKNTNKATSSFIYLNDYYLDKGIFLEISRDLDKPILLNYLSVPDGRNYLYNIRNIIVCKNNSHAKIIEQYNYNGEIKSRYLQNIVNEIFIEDNAHLEHYKYQNEAFKANHIAYNGVSVNKSGLYQAFCLQKGANIARNETEVNLREEGAETKVDVAYLMNGWATIDTTTNIFHNAPHTNSSQLVKGVIGGEAKGVFQGKIHIAPDAVCTNGNQLHKAVLLSDTAEVDVKPELEIFADDVKCSHGAACGELDKEQLFYMQARGIGIEEAKQILVDAYLNDVIESIPDSQLREWFKSLI